MSERGVAENIAFGYGKDSGFGALVNVVRMEMREIFLLMLKITLDKIHLYVTEGTFDAYMWQLLENKQKFIVTEHKVSITIKYYEQAYLSVLLPTDAAPV